MAAVNLAERLTACPSSEGAHPLSASQYDCVRCDSLKEMEKRTSVSSNVRSCT
jgi:hypothetical protein